MKLFNDDCLKVLPTIPDKSIDLILTDPPYGTTACKWDSVIPFEPMWNQLKRVIKDNGCIALFGSEPFSSALRMSNIKWFKYDWIWKKSRPANFMNVKFQPLKQHEIISVFSNKKHNYYPIKVQGNKNHATKTRISSAKSIYNKKLKIMPSCINSLKYPKSIIDIKSEDSTKNLHPTQKPIDLLEYLIKTYTNENDTVLDFTMGSGSTGVACKNLNRDFIGIELDQEYFKIAKERIESTNPLLI
jgi:DNA modification methylase